MPSVVELFVIGFHTRERTNEIPASISGSRNLMVDLHAPPAQINRVLSGLHVRYRLKRLDSPVYVCRLHSRGPYTSITDVPFDTRISTLCRPVSTNTPLQLFAYTEGACNLRILGRLCLLGIMVRRQYQYSDYWLVG